MSIQNANLFMITDNALNINITHSEVISDTAKMLKEYGFKCESPTLFVTNSIARYKELR